MNEIAAKHKGNEKEELKLIPKSEKYIEYMIVLIMKLPRTEKFNIGNEYKSSMHKMIVDILNMVKAEKVNK